ncbi:4a-hydroxytetrahydrobiopterin dehydratase [Amycolatopsis sp. FDAARGOS 1241]|uniref:4a-hydroxytetrahydrobiopterin dehydratase n=1 Tax=Amycolatopsis sp. FDAARGOS 1241 TaxID=2778070 RepID=UPI00194EADC6|nr:4a-hydroxytetrahydrobiopterin dehydratase [Amycolatopsis sp. FDAARGOS 1241]QRP47239.1 4a-hydroxytetrahydrobiopterin dehydratase [Amycolatopsis sp. FDAARGOS 1241]
MAELLSDSEVTSALSAAPDWQLDGASIVRTADLPSFAAAIAAVTRVGFFAEAADHHPDIDVRWRTVTFRLSTHSAGGLTAKDFALAGQIDQVLAAAV